MLQTHLYDGPVLPALLTRIEHEHGAAARIVAARKSRKGGVAGFFSREWYEVTVEIDDQNIADRELQQSPKTTKQKPVLASVLDVVENLNTREADLDSRLLEAAHIAHRREVRTSSAPSFAEVLQSVRGDHTETFGETESADNDFVKVGPLSNGTIVMPDVENQEVIEESNENEPFVPLEQEIQVISQPQPTINPPVISTTTPNPPTISTTTNPPIPNSVEVVRSAASTEIINKLAKKGVPKALLSNVAGADDIQTAIEHALRAVPVITHNDLRQTHLIAVVGSPLEAQKFTRFLARKIQVTNNYIAEVKNEPSRLGEEVIATVEDAIIAKRSWRRRRTPSIVSIPATFDNCLLAENILTAIEPDFIIAVADARQKIEDIEATIEGLGGVDALAINNVSHTSSPASILNVGIPIAFIDEHFATSAVWAAHLTEELQDG